MAAEQQPRFDNLVCFNPTSVTLTTYYWFQYPDVITLPGISTSDILME